MVGQEGLHTERTTPESFELQALFRRMADAGCTHVVMEVSSHRSRSPPQPNRSTTRPLAKPRTVVRMFSMASGVTA